MDWEDVDCIHVVGLCEHANETLSGSDLPSNCNLKMDTLICAVIKMYCFLYKWLVLLDNTML